MTSVTNVVVATTVLTTWLIVPPQLLNKNSRDFLFGGPFGVAHDYSQQQNLLLKHSKISDTILQSCQQEFYYIVPAANISCNASWELKLEAELVE